LRTWARKERLREDLAGRDVAAALQVKPAHAEVAEFVFVREPPDVGAVAHAARPQLELQVDDVLEGRALARAPAVPGADKEAQPLAPPHPLDGRVEVLRGLHGVGVGADR
jgi:hypothetical protein